MWRRPLGFPSWQEEEEERPHCCLLFPEGRDRIWPGAFWHGQELRGFLLPPQELTQPLSPSPKRACPCKAQGEGQIPGPSQSGCS